MACAQRAAGLQLSCCAPGSSPAQLTAVQVGRASARPTTNPAQGAPPPYPCRPAPHAPRRARAHPPCPSHRTIARFAPLSHNSHTRVPTFVQGSTRAFERGAVRLLGMRFLSKNALYRQKKSSGPEWSTAALGGGRKLQRSTLAACFRLCRPLLLSATFEARRWRSSPSVGRLMVFLDFLDFLDFLETSEVAGPGPNPREIDISFGAQWPIACARPDPTIGWTDVLPCVFVCVWGRYPPAAALLVRRLVVPVLNKLLQLRLQYIR